MIDRSQERIDLTGEVFTPDELVERVLDSLPEDIWFDPTKTWLEPACGDGNFLVAVLRRLMISLADVIPDADERHRHIVENQLFGVDLMEDNIQACITRLQAGGLNHNLVCADGTKYHFRFGRVEEFGNGLFEI